MGVILRCSSALELVGAGLQRDTQITGVWSTNGLAKVIYSKSGLCLGYGMLLTRNRAVGIRRRGTFVKSQWIRIISKRYRIHWDLTKLCQYWNNPHAEEHEKSPCRGTFVKSPNDIHESMNMGIFPQHGTARTEPRSLFQLIGYFSSEPAVQSILDEHIDVYKYIYVYIYIHLFVRLSLHFKSVICLALTLILVYYELICTWFAAMFLITIYFLRACDILWLACNPRLSNIQK